MMRRLLNHPTRTCRVLLIVVWIFWFPVFVQFGDVYTVVSRLNTHIARISTVAYGVVNQKHLSHGSDYGKRMHSHVEEMYTNVTKLKRSDINEHIRNNVTYRTDKKNITMIMLNQSNQDTATKSEEKSLDLQNAVNNTSQQDIAGIGVVRRAVRVANPRDLEVKPRKKDERVFNRHQNSGQIHAMRQLAAERRYYTLRKTKVNPVHHAYTISPRHLCANGSPYLLALIPSEPSHFKTRKAIRETMGRYANIMTKDVPDLPKRKWSVKFLFVLGRNERTDTDQRVRNESKTFGDILQADFVDSYYNLTRKMLVSMNWISFYCSDVTYILKFDEDVFVNIPLLVEFLQRKPTSVQGSIYGYLIDQAPVQRKGKWEVRTNEYPLSWYPKYVAGNSYVISGNIVPRMCMIAEYLPYMPIEDVFITGILAKVISTQLVDHQGFTHWTEPKPKPCVFAQKKRISANNVSSALKRELWEKTNWFQKYCKN